MTTRLPQHSVYRVLECRIRDRKHAHTILYGYEKGVTPVRGSTRVWNSVNATMRRVGMSSLDIASATAAVLDAMLLVSTDQLTRVCGPKCEFGDGVLSTISFRPGALHTRYSSR